MKYLGLKIFLLLLAANVLLCVAEKDSSRKKRNYVDPPYSNQQSPNYNNYYNNPIYQPPQCSPPPSCISPSRLPNADAMMDISWLAAPRLMYQTLSSCWGYSLYANIFLGRPVYSLRELQESCMTLFFGNNGLAYITGYGTQLVQSCVPLYLDVLSSPLNCTTQSVDPPGDPTLEIGATAYALATDNKSWILWYQCVNMRMGTFQLYTTRPYLTRSALKKVLPILKSLGFTDKDVMALECYDSTYLVPFQNYPVPDTQLSAFGTCPSNPLQM